MRHGVVVNIDEMTAAIATALDRVERVCGQKIASAYVAVSGRHLSSANSAGSVTIAPGGREIVYQDVVHAIEAARAGVDLGDNRELVHQLPRGYVVDGQDGVPNPIGMAGFKLEVETHVIAGNSTTIQNLIKCVHAAPVELEDLVCAALASAGAVLTPAEREMGTMVVDIGAGTTDLTVFAGGFPWLTGVLTGGGSAITYGIAASLRLPLEVAERLKVTYGHADPRQVPEDALIELPEVGLVLPRSELARVIEAQVRELIGPMRMPLQHAQREGMRPLGVVLTGGTAMLPGLTASVERMLGLPARVGAPRGVRGMSEQMNAPAFSTAAGLLLRGVQQANGAHPIGAGERGRHGHPLPALVGRFFKKAFLP
jgi:cell division protein FtsA